MTALLALVAGLSIAKLLSVVRSRVSESSTRRIGRLGLPEGEDPDTCERCGRVMERYSAAYPRTQEFCASLSTRPDHDRSYDPPWAEDIIVRGSCRSVIIVRGY